MADKRQVRLAQEWLGLQAVNRESDNVYVQAVDVLPGRAPEKYKVTFRCRGIASIDKSRQPVYSNIHEAQIYCHAGFPTDVPWLEWQTPIWHPNIEHAGKRGVCVNKTEWLGGMSLVDLCQQMFEMVQYKNYHAELSPPYPLDAEAATWVRDYAEKRGIVDKKRGIFTDNVLFYKPSAAAERVLRIRIVGKEPEQAPTGSRIKFHPARESGDEGDSKVILGAGAGSIPCPRCAIDLPLDSSFCGNCGSELATTRPRVRFGD
jgi:ubiquitin-protein ligase